MIFIISMAEAFIHTFELKTLQNFFCSSDQSNFDTCSSTVFLQVPFTLKESTVNLILKASKGHTFSTECNCFFFYKIILPMKRSEGCLIVVRYNKCVNLHGCFQLDEVT